MKDNNPETSKKSKIDLGGNQRFKEYGKKQRTIKHFETAEFIEYRRMWSEYPQKYIVAEYPINLDLHITNRCNLKCPFCPRTWKDLGDRYEEKGFMSFDLYKKIVDEAIQFGVKAIQLTGDGEPLLHPDLERMIKYANKKGVLDIILHTNAVGLNEGRSLKLLKAGIHRLAISFDSPVKETYEKLRVGANFENTLENIKRFVNLRDELGLELPTVRVQMVDQEINKNERDKFDQLFFDIADTIGHVYYIDYFGGPDAYSATKKLSVDKFKIGKKKINLKFSCTYFWQRLIIEWNGEVFPCFYGNTLLEKGKSKDLLLGNANNQSMHAIWHSDRMNELRNKHKNKNFSDCKTCKKCGRQFDIYEEIEGLNKDWIPS